MNDCKKQVYIVGGTIASGKSTFIKSTFLNQFPLLDLFWFYRMGYDTIEERMLQLCHSFLNIITKDNINNLVVEGVFYPENNSWGMFKELCESVKCLRYNVELYYDIIHPVDIATLHLLLNNKIKKYGWDKLSSESKKLIELSEYYYDLFDNYIENMDTIKSQVKKFNVNITHYKEEVLTAYENPTKSK